jgi:hypothetical protein
LVEHLTQKQLEDYCRRQLEVAELFSVSDHLDECAVCRRQLENAMNGDSAFLALRSEVFGEAAELSAEQLAGAHLTSTQTAEYVDCKLSVEELQMVADHLSHCQHCAVAVDDLQAFKEQIAPTIEHEYHPASVPTPAESWWQRALAALPMPFRRSPGLAFGAVLAALLLMVTSWLIWRTPRQDEPSKEIIVTPPLQQPPPAVVPPAVPMVAQLNDGEAQLTLDRDGKLSGADDLPPAYQGMLKEALTTRRIERSSQLKGLTRPPSSLMSTDDQGGNFSVIEPAGKVLLTSQPTFRWSPMAGATAYVVEVYDSQFNRVATSPQLTGSSWTSAALARGKLYGWQVKAIKDGQEFTSPRPPAPPARFRILDQGKANELAKARRAYPSSHLVLGLLYAEAGLLKEAEEELRLVQKANPDSEVARSLLGQVQALRRRGL